MESAEGSQADEMTSLAVLQGEIRASIARRAANGEVGGEEVESELAGKEGEGDGEVELKLRRGKKEKGGRGEGGSGKTST